MDSFRFAKGDPPHKAFLDTITGTTKFGLPRNSESPLDEAIIQPGESSSSHNQPWESVSDASKAPPPHPSGSNNGNELSTVLARRLSNPSIARPNSLREPMNVGSREDHQTIASQLYADSLYANHYNAEGFANVAGAFPFAPPGALCPQALLSELQNTIGPSDSSQMASLVQTRAPPSEPSTGQTIPEDPIWTNGEHDPFQMLLRGRPVQDPQNRDWTVTFVDSETRVPVHRENYLTSHVGQESIQYPVRHSGHIEWRSAVPLAPQLPRPEGVAATQFTSATAMVQPDTSPDRNQQPGQKHTHPRP